jgi:O-acetylhomoserine (thiol)-lyase
VPLIVDNTVPSPYLCRPFEHGADIVVHSLTKYLGGHGNSIGGAIVDSGKFPWAEHKARFKRLNEPDVSYHGVVYTEALGPLPTSAVRAWCRCATWARPCRPFNAFLILQGIETLPLRMDRICDNALEDCQLPARTTPRWRGSTTPACPTTRTTPWCKKYMGGKASGILSFGLKAERWPQGGGCTLPGCAASSSPAWSTSAMPSHWPATLRPPRTASWRRRAGQGRREPRGMVRLSVGIEHIDDLLARRWPNARVCGGTWPGAQRATK